MEWKALGQFSFCHLLQLHSRSLCPISFLSCGSSNWGIERCIPVNLHFQLGFGEMSPRKYSKMLNRIESIKSDLKIEGWNQLFRLENTAKDLFLIRIGICKNALGRQQLCKQNTELQRGIGFWT